MSTISNSQFTHPSGDRVLNSLSAVESLIGEFVRNYPGKAHSDSSPNWLSEWFIKRTAQLFANIEVNILEVTPVADLLRVLIQNQDSVVNRPVRLVAIQPHYFRGFRNLADPVNFKGDLIVIEGRNSSGKTSLAEAVEWLLTGELLRRSMQEYGNARELENCISNQLRPEDEGTWVAAELASDTGEHFKLTRVLRSDYGITQTSRAESVLFLNEKELTRQEETKLLEDLFVGVPPLLMQHCLRLFVHSTPAERRNYFERLLQLDELTYLIEKAVMGDARLTEFPSPSGSVSLKRWENLKSSVRQHKSRIALRKAEKTKSDSLEGIILDALSSIAQTEFAQIVSVETPFDQVKQILSAEQKKVREQSFPLLEKLRPRQAVDEHMISLFATHSIQEKAEHVAKAYGEFDAARKAAQLIGDGQIAIAQAFELLSKAGVILETNNPQLCPLCDYRDSPTLKPNRIKEINSWQPLQRTVKKAEKKLEDEANNLLNALIYIANTRRNLIPDMPSAEEWDSALKTSSGKVLETAGSFQQALNESILRLKQFDETCQNLLTILSQLGTTIKDGLEQTKCELDKLAVDLDVVIDKGSGYAKNFDNLEKAVGSMAREDPDYSLRECWLSVADDVDATKADLQWENAKIKAQAELTSIRDILILVRQKLLDQRRTDFSSGMTSVWTKLRADRYSAFRNLFIPEPRGKGFPVEIEVKAILDDGNQQREVDALRVFSESQVNALGIAAFVTRSKLLGHRMLVFDDPVQSMDEEHFKTFASDMIQHLLREGFQLILLTHNDTFAREVSFSCIDLEGYVTMRIRHSRKKGCQIDEGNRRVAERLNIAEHKGEEGKLDEAWRWVRLALERLYTVIYKKYGPSNFNPLSWVDQTAEHMWDSGVGTIMGNLEPGSGLYLKEILNMTVSGAHDKAPKGFTDLTNAIADIRKLLVKTHVGAG